MATFIVRVIYSPWAEPAAQHGILPNRHRIWKEICNRFKPSPICGGIKGINDPHRKFLAAAVVLATFDATKDGFFNYHQRRFAQAFEFDMNMLEALGIRGPVSSSRSGET
jgi:hypothetical protein